MMGFKRRLGRFFDHQCNRTMILPMDHGVSDGLVAGLDDMPGLIRQLAETRVRGVVLHKGMALELGGLLRPDQNLVVHLSAGTKHGLPSYGKTLVCSIQEALRLGADAVSVHINIGNDLEDRMLSDLGMVVDEAHQLGLPVMAMIYARGGQIINELDPHLIAHCLRLGAEVGADLVKVPFSPEQKIFSRALKSCPVPVVVAGGPKQDDFQGFLAMIRSAMDCGAAGISIGRNIFQHPRPMEALDQLWNTISGQGCNEAGTG
ncbi:class I fructose-bisphosphate aldolase [Desulfonatronovibrio hydrogenovorans]|uniref:class I fructose-bisphosphate aldolase n=1 Tax=Desulfonatronovibrio hydrogenovorans TaxID=53245 RepID=UPI00048DD150|nr:2-amino-3,7-dideoxy-D-threo-hept-6-ulosonate synthase [Desulfonatronovibrio hydrogenovorans]